MVISGDFKVELVEANSKIAFKEHTQNNETYVEVEPEAEYFVSFQRVATTTHKVPVKVSFVVDGDEFKLTNYVSSGAYTSDRPMFFGLYKYQNGEAFDKALKFVRPEILDGNSDANTSPMIGKINVRIYERIFTKMKINETVTIPKMDTEKVSGLGNLSGVKVVRSTVGDTEKAIKLGKTISRYGNLLQTIDLNYCTVPGLMQIGIIEKPKDIYKEYKILNPNKRRLPIPSHLKVEPQRKKKRIILQDDNNGYTVVEESYQITYDLSHLPSSDDEEEEEEEDVQSKIFAENNAIVITPQKG